MMNDCSNPSRMNDFSRPRRMSASAFAILFMKSLSEYAGTVFFLVAFLAYKSVGGRSLTEILLSIAAIAVSLFAGLAYYVIWGAAVLLFVLAVWYTVKML